MCFLYLPNQSINKQIRCKAVHVNKINLAEILVADKDKVRIDENDCM